MRQTQAQESFGGWDFWCTWISNLRIVFRTFQQSQKILKSISLLACLYDSPTTWPSKTMSPWQLCNIIPTLEGWCGCSMHERVGLKNWWHHFRKPLLKKIYGKVISSELIVISSELMFIRNVFWGVDVISSYFISITVGWVTRTTEQDHRSSNLSVACGNRSVQVLDW